jgi:hypothetical protein
VAYSYLLFYGSGGDDMLESKFQSKLIKMLRDEYPGCIILKNDPNYIQGIPDLIVLFEDKWAALEIKRSNTSALQANQDWYIGQLNSMSFAAFVYPENYEEVFNALQQTFRPRRTSRVS